MERPGLPSGSALSMKKLFQWNYYLRQTQLSRRAHEHR